LFFNMLVLASLFFALNFAGARAEDAFPHRYPGMPTGEYGPEWQKCTCIA
jgi:hypothetical protein